MFDVYVLLFFIVLFCVIVIYFVFVGEFKRVINGIVIMIILGSYYFVL